MAKTPENSALEFLSSRKTLVMVTAGKNGAPNASYAPCNHRGFTYTQAPVRSAQKTWQKRQERVSCSSKMKRVLEMFLLESASPANAEVR